MSVVWEVLDYFLSRLRSVQRYTSLGSVGGYDYYELQLYDYVWVDEIMTPMIIPKPTTKGVDF